jgi:hypothetical protein
MSPVADDKQRSGRTDPPSEPGVLANLPSTRPQRPSARRATSDRPATGRAQPSKASTKPTAKAGARATAGGAGGLPKPQEPPVPPQGYETERDMEPGVPVQPPSTPELAASAVELVGELAQAGLSAGGRLLKDALTRLPGV